MYILFKKSLITFLIIISFILISYFWKIISVPLINTNETIGIITIQNINPINDTIRYALIISVPLLIYLISNVIFLKKNINIKQFFYLNYKFEDEEKISIRDTKYLFIGLFAIIFFQFVSYDHINLNLDYLHDGDYLTPAYNFISTNKFWSAAFSSHGGSDIFYAALSWKIFNTESIGAVRVFMAFFIVLLKITSIVFVFKLANVSYLNKEYKKALFFFLSTFILLLSDFQFPMNYSAVSYRDVYYLLFFIFIVDFFIFRKTYTFIAIPIVTFLTPLLHIDIGIYLSFLFCLFVIFLILNREIRLSLKILSIYFFCWFLFILLFGIIELKAFWSHLYYMALHVDLVHGFEHPQPIFEIGIKEHAVRGTRGLLIQLIASILILREILFKNRFSKSNKIILIFLFIFSIIAYKNALGRSDAQHIRMSSDFPIIISIFLVLNLFFDYISKKNKKNYLKYVKKFKIVFFVFIVLHVSDFKNIKKLKNLNSFIIEKDQNFLDESSQIFFTKANDLFLNENCIFNFTTDISIPYFLRKKTCNKYFSPWLISGIKLETKYIEDLENIDHKYIIYSSPKYLVDKISTKKRLKIVDRYINENYQSIFFNNGYEILKKLN